MGSSVFRARVVGRFLGRFPDSASRPSSAVRLLAFSPVRPFSACSAFSPVRTCSDLPSLCRNRRFCRQGQRLRRFHLFASGVSVARLLAGFLSERRFRLLPGRLRCFGSDPALRQRCCGIEKSVSLFFRSIGTSSSVHTESGRTKVFHIGFKYCNATFRVAGSPVRVIVTLLGVFVLSKKCPSTSSPVPRSATCTWHRMGSIRYCPLIIRRDNSPSVAWGYGPKTSLNDWRNSPRQQLCCKHEEDPLGMPPLKDRSDVAQSNLVLRQLLEKNRQKSRMAVHATISPGLCSLGTAMTERPPPRPVGPKNLHESDSFERRWIPAFDKRLSILQNQFPASELSKIVSVRSPKAIRCNTTDFGFPLLARWSSSGSKKHKREHRRVSGRDHHPSKWRRICNGNLAM